VSTKRLQLSGPSIEALKARVLAEHGPEARIVAAEEVTVGGIKGFFARRYFEATVEIPEPRRGAHVLDEPRRAGIAALLAEAERQDQQVTGPAPELTVSTNTGGFASLMDNLTFNTMGPAAGADSTVAAEPAAAASVNARLSDSSSSEALLVPAPLQGPGDLVLVVGLGQDPLDVARSMAAQAASNAVKPAGALAADLRRPVADRHAALSARARGVEGGHSVFVAFGLGRAAPDEEALGVLTSLGADQVWVAVDAGRKPKDTASWVLAVQAAVAVAGIAVVGAAGTSTPETVNNLGVPVGWVDGKAAEAPRL
jgi:hypothetical protein